jgi:[ribosomal protein S5]-alanine N-acetyltransferase
MVKLVKHTEKHIEPLVELLNNDNVSKWLINVPYPYTLQKAEEWIGICNEMEDGKDYGFAIELDGKIIGGIGMNVDGRRDAGLDDHKAQIGYWLGEPYWGKGYMTDALRQVLQLAFDELKLTRVYAHTLEGNTASENLLLRNGFEHEGFQKKSHKKGDKIFNANLFAKVI